MNKAYSNYLCADCEEEFDGFPAGARTDGRPLCPDCMNRHLSSSRVMPMIDNVPDLGRGPSPVFWFAMLFAAVIAVLGFIWWKR